MRKFCTALLYKQVGNSAFARRTKEALSSGAPRACSRRARIELQFSRFEKLVLYRISVHTADCQICKRLLAPLRATTSCVVRERGDPREKRRTIILRIQVGGTPPSKHAVRMGGRPQWEEDC